MQYQKTLITLSLALMASLQSSISIGETKPAPQPCHRTKPFVLTPMIEGLGYYEFDGENRLKPNLPKQSQSAAKLRELLDSVEPGGASGQVQLGYTLAVPLLSPYVKQEDGWHFDSATMNAYLDIIRQVPRPVVVYLFGNHFTPATPLVKELATDPDNLMTLANRELPKSNYFSTEVWPFTLSTTPEVPVNHYRYEALSKIMEALKSLDYEIPGRIRAITLLGEVHHLIDDIKTSPGKYQDIQFTDYSQRSKEEFKRWLKTKYKTLTKLNQTARFKFAHWSNVEPPDINIIGMASPNVERHIDAYASGFIPVFGWLDDGDLDVAILVYLDGVRMPGKATRELSRLDVYENVAKITNPSTGFRYDLDYRGLLPGTHRLDVVVMEPNEKTRYLVDTRAIKILKRNGKDPDQTHYNPSLFENLPRLSQLGLEGWLDQPNNEQAFYFNPLAALWQEFREFQVEQFIKEAWRRASATGFDKRRIYSHQLIPYANGSWNDAAFASNKSNRPTSPYHPGVTLYGGQAASNLIMSWIGDQVYGVPEFNPLQDKDLDAAAAALAFHEAHCADFVSPYFMRIDVPAAPFPEGYDNFYISATNPKKGENNFYSAIRTMVGR